ncbi:helix-turn-helix domain-containing protein [Shinella sp. H4-D48]|uniref:helix-turn-helix domain-containing protein n=1 Tax=Shinella sp. H4-D48 TaxID=2925841 RepID=UPI001F53B679|nr:helix-turn-helix transcriptional regulator [Shinella sp. H4-D48]UNK36634.1 helix-turn-helix domain-containing protein [Shinella sp. H4-D48]
MDDPSTCRRYVGMLDYRRVLAENVKAARKALDLSQEALALEAAIDRTYVSGIERGRRNPSLTMIAKLAERLKTTPAALLSPMTQEQTGK